MALSGLGCACTPCAAGFSRGQNGVCFADNPCPDDHHRDENLNCVPDSADHGVPGPESSPDPEPAEQDTGIDTGFAEQQRDLPPEGYGRIYVKYAGLNGLPLHGFFVTGHPVGEHEPSTAFCQVLLAASVDVYGAMTEFDGVSEDCPLQGDVALYANGEVQLGMQVAAGASAEPVLCDERVVEVNGDTLVDFGDVIDCAR